MNPREGSGRESEPWRFEASGRRRWPNRAGSRCALPDGRSLSAGELAGASHQLVHALRARGLSRGDVVAMLLPNAAPALEVLLAAMQAGWYITPINTNLAPPEIAHILRDSGARAFVADAVEAERALRAADEAELPASARIAVGERAGLRVLRRAQARAARHAPDASAARVSSCSTPRARRASPRASSAT